MQGRSNIAATEGARKDAKTKGEEMDYVGTGDNQSIEGIGIQGQDTSGIAVVEEVCQHDMQSRQAGKKASADDLMAMLERQGYKCAACDCDLVPEEANLDHVIPIAKRKKDADHPSNLQWLCRRCNRAKADMDMSEFIALCRAIAAKHETVAANTGTPLPGAC